MANAREDFAPEIRNSAWWASDTRKAANGRGNEAVLTKLGLLEPEDLSNVEAVQLGHFMQDPIMRLAQDRLGIELKEADYMMTHPKEPWLKSHFDAITADGKALVEIKNYSAAARQRFDFESGLVPAADAAQCIHEAAVHGVDRIYLAILFGGQEFQCLQMDVSEAQKEQLVKDMAVFWSAVVRKQPLEPETIEQTRLIYSNDAGTSIIANADIEQVCRDLRAIKDRIKELEEAETQHSVAIHRYMTEHSELVSIDGKVLATWKKAKGFSKFDLTTFKKAYPQLVEQFQVEQPPTRRFLVK